MRSFDRLGACTLAILAALGPLPSAGAEKVLYSFQGGSDGVNPSGALITDNAGNLYGTTVLGGNNSCFGESCGTVFELSPDGTETVLYAFTGGSDGGNPGGSITPDAAGNLYGTTAAYGPGDYGTIFKIGPDGSATTLYTFLDAQMGSAPDSNLILDESGNLFGTTYLGGKRSGCCGIIYELQADGEFDLLYSFKGGTDGRYAGNLITDGSGNLYGVTLEGGGYTACPSQSQGCGTVFKYSSDVGETVLHAFAGGNDGSNPMGVPVMDRTDNLYGTTISGGGTGCGGNGCGTVFKVAPDGTETVLYSFHGSDGAHPYGGAILDNSGNLYGTTNGGGSGCRGQGCGTVFRLAPDGTETTLVFLKGKKGKGPVASLANGPHNILYGTAQSGGASNDGVVLSVKK